MIRNLFITWLYQILKLVKIKKRKKDLSILECSHLIQLICVSFQIPLSNNSKVNGLLPQQVEDVLMRKEKKINIGAEIHNTS